MTGRNRTGPLCSVDRPCTQRSAARPLTALQTTPTDDRHRPAKQYWPVRRASNKEHYTNLRICLYL